MKLYLFDKDGTICRSKSGKKFINDWQDQELIPGTLEQIKALKAQGHKIGIISNQGGVAYGVMTSHEVYSIMKSAQELIEADVVFYCPHHPDAPNEDGLNELAVKCECRKPGIEMIAKAMEWTRTDKKNTVFVGDRPEDEQAAANAGIKFVWAWEFFGRPKPKRNRRVTVTNEKN